MQPLALMQHPITKMRTAHGDPMAIAVSGAIATGRASLERRLAERARARVGASRHMETLRKARLARDAGRTLSALSADDRACDADRLAPRDRDEAQLSARPLCARRHARTGRGAAARTGTHASAATERRRAVTSGTSVHCDRRRM
jgi:hypothetical protein